MLSVPRRLLIHGLILSAAVADRAVRGSIDCYWCSSKNGTDPFCEDPIAPAHLILERRCMVPKENHIGRFPANFCVKMIGTSVTTGITLVVRTCVLEDMNSQCGTFIFEDEILKGCVLTCNYDGCNLANNPLAASGSVMIAVSVAHMIWRL